MVSLILKKILANFGIKIIRLQTSSEKKLAYSSKPIPKNEKKQTTILLNKYVRLAKDRGSEDHYESLKDARGYLSNDRMREQRAIVDIAREVGVIFNNKTVVDVGCGLGYTLRYIEQTSKRVELIGYDPSDKTELCGPILCNSAIFFKKILEKDDPITADIYILTQVLEHLEEPSKLLSLLASKLKRPGHIILSVPNGRVDGLGAGSYLPNRGAYTGHINFWSHQSFQKFLIKNLENALVQTRIIDCGQLVAVIKLS